ncbi:MAG: efflux RND transporter periplasmic adaptor subunit, partial [candidate division Zixibacteria bacterium]|nr:efflux RND transporter periplasmic adaptor subunit [candidate division Zixibacteria bacterium]
MNKKTVYIIIAFLVVAGVVGLLLRNRAALATGTSGVELSAYPVTVTTAQRMPLNNALTCTGTITANNDVAIVAETSGRVKAIQAKVGDTKKAGAVLIEVDDELAAANCAAAEVAYEKAKRDLERTENLLKNNSVSESQFEGVRLNCRAAETQYIAKRRALTDTKITTPIAGTVTSCAVDTGTMVQYGMTVANVVDIATLKVKANLPEEDVFKLDVGDTAEVTTDVYPGVTFQGIIHTIGSKADEAHTYPVEIALSNSDNNPLKANMFGRVTFNPRSRREALVL